MPLYRNIQLPGRPDLDNVRRLDILAIEPVRQMMRLGMAIDRDWFRDLSSRLAVEMDDLRADICSHIPPEKLDEFIARSNLDSADDYLPMNVDSGDQLARLLFDVLGIGEGRSLKMTKSGARVSTGKKQLEQIKRESPLVQIVLDYRERAKLKSTYCDTLPVIAKWHPRKGCWCGLDHQVWTVDGTWRIHCDIMTTRTSTGRLATKKPNLQNIPARKRLGREVRKGFIASPGTVMVDVDFSQIEMRLGAHYSRDSNLLRIFWNDLDPHEDTARRAFGLGPDDPIDKMTQRDPSKTTNFQIFYGGTERSIHDTLVTNFGEANLEVPDWLTVEWCRGFREQWFDELYPDVEPNYIAPQHYRARRYELVWDLFGRIRRVPEVRSVHERVQEAGLRQAGNMPIQSTAGELMKLAFVEYCDRLESEFRSLGIWAWPLNVVHDEGINEVEEGYGEIVQVMMEDVMSNVMTDRETGEDLCCVPITADGKTMTRWEK